MATCGFSAESTGARPAYAACTSSAFRQNFTQGHNGPRYGWLLDHPQLQLVIDVAPDRRTAQARGRSTMQAGLHQTAEGNQRAWWEGGIYENDYVRGNNVWKIKALRYFPFWHGTFAEGWQKTPIDFVPMSKVCYPRTLWDRMS